MNNIHIKIHYQRAIYRCCFYTKNCFTSKWKWKDFVDLINQLFNYIHCFSFTTTYIYNKIEFVFNQFLYNLYFSRSMEWRVLVYVLVLNLLIDILYHFIYVWYSIESLDKDSYYLQEPNICEDWIIHAKTLDK